MNWFIILIISITIGLVAGYFFLQWWSSSPKEKIAAAAKKQEKTKGEYKSLLDNLADKTPAEMKQELSKLSSDEEKKQFVKEVQTILQEVKTKEELDQKAYSYWDYGYAAGVLLVVTGLVFWLIKWMVGSAKSNE